jgi:hypothetical protein
MMTCVLCIADKCIKKEFHNKITLIARRRIRKEICSVIGRKGINLTEGIGLYFS